MLKINKVDYLNSWLDFLEGESLGLGDERLAESDGSLAGADDCAAQHHEVLVHEAVAWEATLKNSNNCYLQENIFKTMFSEKWFHQIIYCCIADFLIIEHAFLKFIIINLP